MATFTSQSVSESNVPADKSTRQISKWTCRRSKWYRWCLNSVAALLAEEIGRLALRIAALLRRPSRYGRRALLVPRFPDTAGRLSFAQENAYLHACNEDILRLSRENRWAGVLDRQIMIQAHQAGALWAFRRDIRGSDGV